LAAQELQDLLVLHQRVHAHAARHAKDVELRALGEREVGCEHRANA
jgi:hypothetical protein